MPSDLCWELTVVDNNSDDATREVVERFAASSSLNVRYECESKPGLSHARNTGVERTAGEIIAFTDDDVILDKAWLARIRAAFKDVNCMVVGGKVVPVWPGPKPPWYEERGPFASPRAIVSFDLGNELCIAHSYPCGANMAFRRELFGRYGKFRVDLGRTRDILMGGEDFEFFQRLMDAGEHIVYLPDATVFHPVTKNRLDKKYFEAWCFNGGKSAVRFEGLPKDAIYYFGFPRYYLRQLFENAVKFAFTLDATRRFYYKLQICILAGRIVETRQQFRTRRTTA